MFPGKVSAKLQKSTLPVQRSGIKVNQQTLQDSLEKLDFAEMSAICS